MARRQCSYSVYVSVDGSKLSIAFFFACFQRLAAQERNLLVQDIPISGRLDVMRDDERQPEQIVGAACPHAAPARRVPPMEHVACLKLMLRGLKQVCSRAISGAHIPAPSRPAIGHGSRMPRWIDRNLSAPRCGTKATDRAASGSASNSSPVRRLDADLPKIPSQNTPTVLPGRFHLAEYPDTT